MEKRYGSYLRRGRRVEGVTEISTRNPGTMCSPRTSSWSIIIFLVKTKGPGGNARNDDYSLPLSSGSSS
jgi:hypothetical protein